MPSRTLRKEWERKKGPKTLPEKEVESLVKEVVEEVVEEEVDVVRDTTELD